MKKFLKLFKKVGGKKIVLQYWNAHILNFVIIQILLNGLSKKSLEIVRLAANNRNLIKLRKKYKKFITLYKKKENIYFEKKRSNKVWVCWLQGMENAPVIVKKCYESLQKNLINREIVLITKKNYKKYVEIPNYIQEKIDKGIITMTHFSDILRLEVLSSYGGTWIDATVFCTGNSYPKYIMDSDLFVFQALKPGLDGHCTSISSWLMTSCSNNPIILLTKALLYEYWKKENKMVDYFLIHDFFQLAIETYPEEWKKVIPFSNSIPHILLLRLFEEYDENVWNAVKDMTSFHKLSYKFEEDKLALENTYYQNVINN